MKGSWPGASTCWLMAAKPFHGALAKPPTVTGSISGLARHQRHKAAATGKPLPTLYRDVAVLAYPQAADAAYAAGADHIQ